jgi:hypothetical protein
LNKLIVHLGCISCIIFSLRLVRLMLMRLDETYSRVWVGNICLTCFVLRMVCTYEVLY